MSERLMTGPPADGYLLDNGAFEAKARFAALSEVFDEVTQSRLDKIEVGSGWRCWEVGAGGPSVPRLLAERIGSTGKVLATDIDIRWLESLPSSVEVRPHDVASQEPPVDGFDLVHARLVLVHLRQRDDALRRMISAVRPGGWLLVEDFDNMLLPLTCLDPQQPCERLAIRVRTEFHRLLAQRGVDLAFGRKLLRLFRQAQLANVTADAFFPISTRASRALEIANVQQVRAALIAHGRLTQDEVDAHLHHLSEGSVDVAMPPLIGVWGQRPETT